MLSEKYKCLWIIPEGCESQDILNILNDLEFNETMCDVNKNSDLFIISTVKNPYIRIFDLYKKHILNNITIKKTMEDFIIKDFNKWVEYSFNYEKFVVDTSKSLDSEWNKYEPQEFISEFKFINFTPHYFVRLENLNDDIRNLKFIPELNVSSNLENSKIPSNVYSKKSAKIIFEYYKKHFYLNNYDPFSFTDQKLSEFEKISFIHELF